MTAVGTGSLVLRTSCLLVGIVPSVRTVSIWDEVVGLSEGGHNRRKSYEPLNHRRLPVSVSLQCLVLGESCVGPLLRLLCEAMVIDTVPQYGSYTPFLMAFGSGFGLPGQMGSGARVRGVT
jgi:hypothetical protein